MLTIMNIKRQKTAILENAYSVSYEKQTNKISSASFFLPLNDPKVDKVQQLGYVEIVDTDGEYIGLFRIMPSETVVSVQANRIKFECVHVLSLLMDSVMFRYHEISPNTTTRAVLEYLLSLQKEKHWKLGKCEFTRYFQYSWENENGLISAIWSVANPFDEEYQWTYDTTSYPWTINLIRPTTDPVCRVRENYNLTGFTVTSNPNQLINRIYPLGQGEGINQLNIQKVNPTGEYFVENTESIAQFGLVEYVWVDRRFTDQHSLYSSAMALLEKWKKPLVTWEISAVDLLKTIPKRPGQKIPEIDRLREGTVVRVTTDRFGTLDLRILKESKADMYGNPHDIKLTIGYVPSDLGTTQADVERSIQINQLYSQGATNILNYDKADNCDPDYPVKFEIFIDDDVVKINTCELTFSTSKFRAYSKAIKGGGATVQSTSAGGGSIQSTSSGGGSVQGGTSASGGGSVQGGTSESGGASVQTSTANGSHTHDVFVNGRAVGTTPHGEVLYSDGNGNNVVLDIAAGGNTIIRTAQAADNHSHTTSIPAHVHNFNVSIPNHSHDFSVNIPAHTHTVDIPAHTHEIMLPDHTHEIEYGIFESKESAARVEIMVDDNVIPNTEARQQRLNIAGYLSKSEDGTIQRGWHTITMTPDTLSRIEAQITMRVFIKSQLGADL